MAIDRSAYNALVDDTGSGNGTIWDKSAIKTVLLDPIDAAIAAGVWTVISNTATGATNNWAPAGLAGNTLIEWNGAADAAFTGLAGGTAGQLVTIKNITAAKIATFAHLVTSSAANQFTNYATSAPTPIAPNGSITYQHDGTKWKIVGHDQGAWISPAYAGGNFTASTGTWTVDSGDVEYYSYHLRGRTMTVQWALSTTSVSATPSNLWIAVPGGFTAPKNMYNPVWVFDNSAKTTGVADLSTNIVRITRLDVGNFATATNTTGTYGELTFEVS